MKRLFQFITAITLLAVVAPIVAVAQTDARERARAALEAGLPDGVTLQTATAAQIDAALDAALQSLGGEEFTNLSGEIAGILAEAQPTQAEAIIRATIRRVPSGNVGAAAGLIASGVAGATQGVSGAPTARSIANATILAASQRSAIDTQNVVNQVARAVPSAAAELLEQTPVEPTPSGEPAEEEELEVPDFEDPSPTASS